MAVDILAIGAHPDDAEIGCSGLLLKAQARGKRTGILVLTQGEMGSFGDRKGRIAEARAAAEILEVDFFRMLDMPDAGLDFNYDNALRIAGFLKELQPRIVLTPDGDDHHPDHQVVPRLVERAIYLATRQSLFPEHEILMPMPMHLTFPVSFQRVRKPNLVINITDVYGVKQKALQAHSSQYGPILFAVEIAARFFGMMIPAAYGEGFYSHSPLLLTDEFAII
jgi:bacillithiol biosynthesis deacetylase BshB1